MAVGAARGALLRPIASAGWTLVPLTNWSFESPVMAAEGDNGTPVGTWVTATELCMVWWVPPNRIDGGAVEGNQVVLMQGTGSELPPRILQTNFHTIKSSTRYRVSFYAGKTPQSLEEDDFYAVLGSEENTSDRPRLDITGLVGGQWSAMELVYVPVAGSIGTNLFIDIRSTSIVATHQVLFDSVIIEEQPI